METIDIMINCIHLFLNIKLTFLIIIIKKSFLEIKKL